MNASTPQSGHTSNNSKQTSIIASLDSEIRRPIIKSLNFLGLKSRKWCAFSQNELFIYKSHNSISASQKFALSDFEFIFPPDQKPSKSKKTSKTIIKLIHRKKHTYFLQALDHQDYLSIKNRLEQSSNSAGNISKSNSVQNAQQSNLVHIDDQNKANGLTHHEVPIIKLARVEEDNELEINWDENDVEESNELERTLQKSMVEYSQMRLRRKITLEERFANRSHRNVRFYSYNSSTNQNDEVSEGAINFTIPFFNVDVSNLKTKRATDRSIIDIFQNQISYKKQLSLTKNDSNKLIQPNPMNLPKSFAVVKEQFDDEIEEQFAKRRGKKRDFLEMDHNASQEIIISPQMKASEIGQQRKSLELSKGYHSDEEALKAEENIILKTLTYANEIREIKDEYKVFWRMQSKKDKDKDKDKHFYRQSSVIEQKQDSAYKPEKLRKHRTDCPDVFSSGIHFEIQKPQKNDSNADKVSIGNASLEEATELLNNFEIKRAKEMFVALSKQNPRLKIFVIECDLLVLSLTGFRDLVDSCLTDLIQLSNQLNHSITSYKLDANVHFETEVTKAECLLLRGLLNAILSNKWQAFLCMSESWRIVHKLEIILNNPKIKPNLSHEIHYRILFAIGAFNLAFSLVPSGLLKLLKFIGITPDKERGLVHLQACWNAKFSRSVYAALLVSCYYLEFELEPQKACEVVEGGLLQYSNFPLFSWVGAILSWRFTQVNYDCLYFV